MDPILQPGARISCLLRTFCGVFFSRAPWAPGRGRLQPSSLAQGAKSKKVQVWEVLDVWGPNVPLLVGAKPKLDQGGLHLQEPTKHVRPVAEAPSAVLPWPRRGMRCLGQRLQELRLPCFAPRGDALGKLRLRACERLDMRLLILTILVSGLAEDVPEPICKGDGVSGSGEGLGGGAGSRPCACYAGVGARCLRNGAGGSGDAGRRGVVRVEVPLLLVLALARKPGTVPRPTEASDELPIVRRIECTDFELGFAHIPTRPRESVVSCRLARPQK